MALTKNFQHLLTALSLNGIVITIRSRRISIQNKLFNVTGAEHISLLFDINIMAFQQNCHSVVLLNTK